MYVSTYTSPDGFYYPEYKKIKMGKRIFPYNFTEDGEIMNINNVRFLGKGCNFPYLAYMYLQFISYSDKDTRTEYRKVYVESNEYNTLGIRSMSRAIRSGNETVSKNLKYLKDNGFMSEETYQDKFGKYHKIYSLDSEIYTYVPLDFDNIDFKDAFRALRNKPIELLIYYKFNSIGKGYYHGNYTEIAKEMGISRDVLASYNRVLVKLKLLRIEKQSMGENKYSNRYYVLV